jgi:hypothetical protein
MAWRTRLTRKTSPQHLKPRAARDILKDEAVRLYGRAELGISKSDTHTAELPMRDEASIPTR